MSALEIKSVSKSFGGVAAVNQLSLHFEEGAVTSLIGPNGAGKTTVFNLISGFLKADAGEIFYYGKNIVGLPPWRIASFGLGRMFQELRVFNRMTVRENVLTAFKRQKGENALMSIIVRRQVSREQRELATRADSLLEFVGLAGKAEELAETLSFGQQKLLAVARLLAAEAKVLLLDEPTAGVNLRTAAPLLGVIRKLAEENRTVVVIEHNMNIVSEISNHVYFIDKGRAVSSGTATEVLEDRAVRASYLGIQL